MCFSATASFAASGVIGTGGIITNMRRLTPAQRLYALIPVLFAIQQAIEGIQWLVINRTGHPNLALGYAFVFFAFLLWPVYMSFSSWMLEENLHRKKIIFCFFVFGTLLTLTLLIALIVHGLRLIVLEHSLAYGINTTPISWLFPLFLITYTSATFGSLLLSSYTWIRLFGVVGVISLIVALIIWNTTYASVWCFFAAILSAIVFLQVRSFTQQKT